MYTDSNINVNNFTLQAALFNQKHGILLDHKMQKQSQESYAVLENYGVANEAISQPVHQLQVTDNIYDFTQQLCSLQIRTCTHVGHPSCYQKISQASVVHQCPLCRYLGNVQLPIAESIDPRQMYRAIIALASTCHNVLVMKESAFRQVKQLDFSVLDEVYDFLEGTKELA